VNPRLLQDMLSAFIGLVKERQEVSDEATRLDTISSEAVLAASEMHDKLTLYTALANSTARWLVHAGVPWETVKGKVPNVSRTYEEDENHVLFGREVPL